MREDEDSPPSAVTTWRWFGWGTSLIVGGIIVTLVIGAVLFFIGTAASGIKGKGDVIRQNNNGNNRIAAQDAFNKEYAAIQTDQGNIATDSAASKAAPNDAFLASVVTADSAQCRRDVNQYNGDAQDTTMKDWRPSKLPESIDANTTCEVPK